MTLGIKGLFETFSMTILYHSAESHYAQCRVLLIVMLNAVMQSVVMLSVIMLNAVMLNVIMLSVFVVL
jgi:hypothetical protein